MKDDLKILEDIKNQSKLLSDLGDKMKDNPNDTNITLFEKIVKNMFIGLTENIQAATDKLMKNLK